LDLKKQIIEISSAMASRFIKASIDENQQKKLADEVISELGDVKWQN
jgi:F0F1-type ATP synthase membrane subunit b/b'